MLRRFVLLFLAGLLGCATPPPAPVVWYVLSPTPDSTYPHGDLHSPMSTWTQIKQFATQAERLGAINDLHNQLHRPMECVASNDKRLLFPPPQ